MDERGWPWRLRPVVAVAACAALALACTGPERAPNPSPSAVEGTGGTIRAALLYDVTAAFDPQREYYNVAAGLFRCCLLRTLLSYPGLPASEGGLELQPDLALEHPEVSTDGLTLTFRLKEGIRYAPPFAAREVVAEDVVRALERELTPEVLAGYAAYYTDIDGAMEFQVGDADSIAGLSTPDPHTLVVRLTTPVADMPYRFALPATAPIPPGAATGHDEGYGRYLVASGPYMFEGSEELDPALPPEDQPPVAGYEPGVSIALVRNPSWERATDALRPAPADRIEISIGGDPSDLALKVEAGELDIVLDANPTPAELSRYLEDPDLRERLFTHPSEALVYASMNLATPPFDDVHVRRAMNLAIDKSALVQAGGGELAATPIGHLIPSTLLDDELATFDPYGTPSHRGDPVAAREEMASSTYDRDGDGRCDDPVCDPLIALAPADPISSARSTIITRDLAEIGIHLRVRELDFGTLIAKASSPAAHVPLTLLWGWFADFPSGSTFAVPLFFGPSLADTGTTNWSLVGASPAQLRTWGYTIESVPSVDARITACRDAAAEDQARCWSDVDRYLMDEVVPFVPLLSTSVVRTASSRVVGYSLDQSTLFPALDRMST